MFDYQWEDGNFVYAKDHSRGIQIALPVWYPGLRTAAYWSINGVDWYISNYFNYFLLLGNECDSDTEKPTIDSFCRWHPSGHFVCTTPTSHLPSFPAKMPDNRFYLESSRNLKDNCANNLTIIQNPAPRTLIESPRRIEVFYEIIDNQGNVLKIQHTQIFKLSRFKFLKEVRTEFLFKSKC